jgi:hypothetical protein
MSTQIIKDLNKLLPDIKFRADESFYWSPEKKLISYNEETITKETGVWALLHEAAHAKLKHNNYSSDLALLKLEVEAWDEAKLLASLFHIKINEDHVQDCLDTYRDWLYRRSTCPACEVVCLQVLPTSYKCHNCHTTWSVSASRFCRPYRLKVSDTKEKRLQPKATTFS